jgi:predicted alpha/beta hydrolase family esterase
MWIRDVLPKDIPQARIVLWGYDTTLVQSNSFQTIDDLALQLIHALKASCWSSPSRKPLFFLAHSLGGIILKQALVTLAGSGAREHVLLDRVRGALFFGVPSHGMTISHLLSMVGEQPNRHFVETLSENSDYLRSLDDRFSGISYLKGMRLFWAYETRTSPTVIVSLVYMPRYSSTDVIAAKQRRVFFSFRP